MIHTMKLFKQPFDRIKSGKKVIEVRLNDEKRSKVNTGDIIIFRLFDNPNEKVEVDVIGLSKFRGFRDLYSRFSCHMFGHPEGITLGDQIRDIREVYSEERENQYGVLGIHICLKKLFIKQ